jgi:hypothetical protein
MFNDALPGVSSNAQRDCLVGQPRTRSASACRASPYILRPGHSGATHPEGEQYLVVVGSDVVAQDDGVSAVRRCDAVRVSAHN